jgi:CRP-like cAMP-binding protein
MSCASEPGELLVSEVDEEPRTLRMESLRTERPMSDECIEVDKANTGIAARSRTSDGNSKSGGSTGGNIARKSLPPFWPLLNDPHKFLVKIGAGRSTSDYAVNSYVFVQGAVADSIFYLQQGRVKATVTSEGKEATVAILETGQFFGDGCLSGQTHRIVSTKALTDCRITAIEKGSMIEALEDQPWFSRVLMDHLFKRDRRIEGDVMDHLFSSSEQRLARLVLDKIDLQRTLLQSVLRDKLGTDVGDADDQ